MSDPITSLRKFVRDALNHPQNLVLRGRGNFEREMFSDNYIVVDDGVSTKNYSKRKFDPVAEMMRYVVNYNGEFTINFFGLNARRNADIFVAQLKSQNSVDLQRTLGITIYTPSTLVDLRFLAGADFGERYELTFMMRYNVEYEVETLRIDSAEISFIDN